MGKVTLSSRQREVATLKAQGFTDDEISIEIGIKPSTVKFHCRAVMDRTGSRNMTQACAALAYNRDIYPFTITKVPYGDLDLDAELEEMTS